MILVMKYSEVSYRKIFEGFLKVNVCALCLFLIMLYMNLITISDYFSFMKCQFFAVLFSTIIAKIYEKFRFKHNKKGVVYMSSMYVGTFLSVIVFFIFGELLLHKVENYEVLIVSIVLGALWIVYVFIILKINEYLKLKWLVTLLDKKISYKNIFQLFLLLNIAFAFVLILFILLNTKYSALEMVFIFAYLEGAFLAFNIIVAKIIDLVWLKADFSNCNVSLMGLVFASILYVIKLRLVEERFFGIFDDTYINDYKAFVLMITLSLLWVFFVLLFNFRNRKSLSS